jgi:UDP-3-O-[3-hydroxymyristoyl] glucosamine N-acyltransferase
MTPVPPVLTLRELADRLGAELRGDPGCKIHRIGSLQTAGAGDISFLSNPHLRDLLTTCAASAVIVAPADAGALRGNGLIAQNPHAAFARVAAWLHPEPAAAPGVHPSAVVDPGARVHAQAWVGPQAVIEAGARIGAGCQIGPGCFVGRDASIGDGSRLVANVTICHQTQLGRNVIVHPGAVIGADGFGLADDQGRWLKVPQIGRVVIGDEVEIGANTTIDRGAIEDTVIGHGVKLDNLIQIAHNVQIGDHTAIAACTGIAGSTRIGRHCAIGGGVGIVGHLEIADNVTVTATSFVSQSIPAAGVYSSGTPLEENARWHRNYVRVKQLDDMAQRLRRLEKRMASPGSRREGKDE